MARTVGALRWLPALLAATACLAVPATAAQAKVRLVKCDDAPGGRCGTVRVPLDRADPSRGTLPIFFAYYKHRARGPARSRSWPRSAGRGPPSPRTRSSRTSTAGRSAPCCAGATSSCSTSAASAAHGDPVRRASAAARRTTSSAPSRRAPGGSAPRRPSTAAPTSPATSRPSGARWGSAGSTSTAARPRRWTSRPTRAALPGPPALRLARLAEHVAWPARLRRDDGGSRQPRGAAGLLALAHVRRRSRRRAGARRPAGGPLARAAARGHGPRCGRKGAHPPRDGGVPALEAAAGRQGHASRRSARSPRRPTRTPPGDPAPLLRLAAEHDEPPFGGDEARVFSEGDSFARFCTDHPMAWDKGAPLDVRRQQWQAAVAALPADRFAPFSIEGWLAPYPIGFQGPDDACLAWPGPADGTAPGGPAGRDVPAFRARADPQRRP